MEKSNLIVVEDVDVYDYPKVKDAFTPNKNIQFTLGDMHSNAIKFLYFLIRQNILAISKEDYDQLVYIYLKDVYDVSQNDISFFNKCIHHAHRLHRARIQILGDDLADRGSNDYFMLKIFEKLSDEHIPFEVLLSNHNIEFIWSYERGLKEFSSPRIELRSQRSLGNLGILINNDILKAKDIKNIKRIVQKNYLPNLKPIAYTIDKPNQCIMLFTHAPIGFDVIPLLAKRLDVKYLDDNIKQLTQTLDRINAAFTKQALAHHLTNLAKLNRLAFDSKINPFYLITWKRGYRGINILPAKNDYHLKYVHGHDGGGYVEPIYRDYVTNLDNLLGKGPAPKNAKLRLDRYEILVTEL